jgi:hypothetical protein
MASLPLLRLLALALAVAGMAVAEEGGRFKPVDTDCMTWHYVTKGTYSPSKDGPPLVVGRQHKLGDVASTPSLQMVCASPEGQIGHFDWNGMGRHGKMQSDRCHIHGSPAIHLPPPWWIATYATSNLSWSDASQGQRVPSNAYQIGGLHLGRNIPTDPAKDKKLGGNVLPGWVVVKNGLLGELMYRDWDNKVEESYEIATCHKPTLLRYRCDNETSRCVTVNATGSNSSCADAQTGCAAAVSGGLLSCATDLCPTCPKKHLCDKTCQFCGSNSSNSSSANASTFPTQQACAAACIAPPPPPLSKNPCIRFGHAIPSEHHVDVEIVQDPPGPNISHTWTNFKFTDFSDWVNVFKPGSGTITIWENVGGVRGAQIYSLPKIPLTPGPLLVVIKVAGKKKTFLRHFILKTEHSPRQAGDKHRKNSEKRDVFSQRARSRMRPVSGRRRCRTRSKPSQLRTSTLIERRRSVCST